MTDPLDELLEEARTGDAPPPFGKLELVVSGSPVSVQSAKPVRDAYIQSIASQLASYKFILTGEIIMNVTWLIPSKSRFETDAKSDIDNCIKPIIDAFAGPDRLFVDDCQLRGLYICWRHIESHNERLQIEFEFQPDDFSAKRELAFVRLEKGLCTPVNLGWPRAARLLFAEYLRVSEKSKAMLERLGISYPAVAGFLGNSRPFHVTRVQQFRVLTLDEFTTCD